MAQVSSSQIIVDVPYPLANLPALEREALIQAGIRAAVEARIRELMREIEEAEDKVKALEERYGLSFTEFEQAGLPQTDSFQAHEDYNDWFYWSNVLAEKARLLAQLQG